LSADSEQLARAAGQRLGFAQQLLLLAGNCRRDAVQPLLQAAVTELSWACCWHLLAGLPEPLKLSRQSTLQALCDQFAEPSWLAGEHAHHAVVVELHGLAGRDQSWLVALANAAGQAYALPAAEFHSALTADRLAVVDLSGQRWQQPVDWSVAAVQKWYDNATELVDRHREQAVEC
jgi:hypothetical protein